MDYFVPFLNRSLDKKKLSVLLLWVRFNCGENEALKLVENLKSLGFSTATHFALSLGIDDLIPPKDKNQRVITGEHEIAFARTQWKQGKRTSIELFQQIVDTWHQISENLKDQVIDQFHGLERMNSVYMMAFSGARGNLSQVRQLVSMRGLMANPQGEIVGFPIISNFREGLTMTEYFVSCYGARKGVIDTALRTADAGYLTRRLVDVAHHVVVRNNNCGTTKYIRLLSSKKGLSLAVRLVGRVSAETIYAPEKLAGLSSCAAPTPKFLAITPLTYVRLRNDVDLTSNQGSNQGPNQGSDQGSNQGFEDDGNNKTQVTCSSKMKVMQSTKYKFSNKQVSSTFKQITNKPIIVKNQEITEQIANTIVTFRNKVKVRSPLTCVTPVCQLCYGYALAENRRVSIGEAVGILAAQSLGEPGTQLTLRTFHTGGVFSGDQVNALYAPYEGRVYFSDKLSGDLIRTAQGDIAFLTSKKNILCIVSEAKLELSDFKMLQSRSSSMDPSLHAIDVIKGVTKGDSDNKTRVTYPERSLSSAQRSLPSPLATVQGVGATTSNLVGRDDSTRYHKVFLTDTNKQQNNSFSVPINTGTIIFVRNYQYVLKNQLLTNFFSQQAKIRLTSEEYIFADFSGQVVHLLPNMNFWVVAGILPPKSLSSLRNSRFFYNNLFYPKSFHTLNQSSGKHFVAHTLLFLETGYESSISSFQTSPIFCLPSPSLTELCSGTPLHTYVQGVATETFDKMAIPVTEGGDSPVGISPKVISSPRVVQSLSLLSQTPSRQPSIDVMVAPTYIIDHVRHVLSKPLETGASLNIPLTYALPYLRFSETPLPLCPFAPLGHWALGTSVLPSEAQVSIATPSRRDGDGDVMDYTMATAKTIIVSDTKRLVVCSRAYLESQKRVFLSSIIKVRFWLSRYTLYNFIIVYCNYIFIHSYFNFAYKLKTENKIKQFQKIIFNKPLNSFLHIVLKLKSTQHQLRRTLRPTTEDSAIFFVVAEANVDNKGPKFSVYGQRQTPSKIVPRSSVLWCLIAKGDGATKGVRLWKPEQSSVRCDGLGDTKLCTDKMYVSPSLKPKVRGAMRTNISFFWHNLFKESLLKNITRQPLEQIKPSLFPVHHNPKTQTGYFIYNHSKFKQKILFKNEALPCVPLQHQKTLQCSINNDHTCIIKSLPLNASGLAKLKVALPLLSPSQTCESVMLSRTSPKAISYQTPLAMESGAKLGKMVSVLPYLRYSFAKPNVKVSSGDVMEIEGNTIMSNSFWLNRKTTPTLYPIGTPTIASLVHVTSPLRTEGKTPITYPLPSIQGVRDKVSNLQPVTSEVISLITHLVTPGALINAGQDLYIQMMPGNSSLSPAYPRVSPITSSSTLVLPSHLTLPSVQLCSGFSRLWKPLVRWRPPLNPLIDFSGKQFVKGDKGVTAPSVRASKMHNSFWRQQEAYRPEQGLKKEKLKKQVFTASESGQVIKIDSNKIILRRAHCYFISSKGSLSVVNKEYIKKGNGLFNLKYEKLLTGDIVQGLGKIEELLEYPKLSLNLNFKTCLRRYLTKISLDKAIEWSYAELQIYLVQSIQQVYVDQGCFISDKHLEIIVRQATCFGIILFPGDTGFLHHEVVPIENIEKINKQLINLQTVHPLTSMLTSEKLNLDSAKIMNPASSKVMQSSSITSYQRFTSYVRTSPKETEGKIPLTYVLASEAPLPSAPFPLRGTGQRGTSVLPSEAQVSTPSGRDGDEAIRSRGTFPLPSSSLTEGTPLHTYVQGMVTETFGKMYVNYGYKKNKKIQKAIYYPHLKGITWNSLNSNSILSAASFQETRRVLRDNLVTDKVDFLKGIKERIILGELLEIGTGFFKNRS